MVMLHIKLHKITKNSNMVGNNLPADPPPPHTTLGGRDQTVKLQLFQNIIMLHIKLKGITKCSNMVANICPRTSLGMGSIGQTPRLQTPNDLRGMGSNDQDSTFVQNMVMLHINLNGITKYSNMVGNILLADHPTSLEGVG